MTWKENLSKFERNKQWDDAIAYMQNVIAENPNDVDAAICMNYLLMYVIVYEGVDEASRGYHMFLTKKYFKESYAKFSEDSEYLFFTGKTAVMGQWYFDLEDEDLDNMLEKARQLDKNNLLYQWICRPDSHVSNLEWKYYSKALVADGSPARKQLESKGAVGAYLLEMIIGWSATYKEKLCNDINEYLFSQMSVESFCDSCRCYYLHGSKDGEFNQQEEQLFSELHMIASRYIESTKNPTRYTRIPFSESELRQKALQVQQVLKL
ncbi:MAG TPA: hypothetical protein VGT41_02770 [Candidatus Babeliales bacterium]|nr:hypothetical protein [Candidatus Babeliales bacterium]